MKIPSPRFRDIGPSAPAKIRSPVVWRDSVVALPFSPIIEISVRRAGFLRFDEPPMLIRGVVHHQIHDNSNAPAFRFGNQMVHIRHRAEIRIDGAIVGNVIAIVGIGRSVNRRKPKDANAKVFQIVQLGNNSRDIPDAITIRIAKRARVDLIDHVRLKKLCFHGFYYGASSKEKKTSNGLLSSRGGGTKTFFRSERNSRSQSRAWSQHFDWKEQEPSPHRNRRRSLFLQSVNSC